MKQPGTKEQNRIDELFRALGDLRRKIEQAPGGYRFDDLDKVVVRFTMADDTVGDVHVDGSSDEFLAMLRDSVYRPWVRGAVRVELIGHFYNWDVFATVG